MLRTLVCGMIACFVAQGAAAQPRDAAGEPWAERFFNPQPLMDDVHLPMPCGGTMVFRRIDVLREGAGSRRIVVGGNDPRFQYAEASREEFVEGAFTDRSDARRRYFFMAKYEVSELQHAALNGECRTPQRDSLKPAVRITWFDAVQSAQRYTEWLLQNARDRLPREGESHGFLRLPTEAEWEFAARGGNEVTAAEFEAATFPMADGIEKYVWFRSTRSSNSELQIVGALKPNPLGLHDILGNADEVILESFRLYRAGGARGQSGGYVVKGGNYQTPETDIRSAYRHEIAPFDASGPRRVPTVGYRLVLVAAVIPSRERLEEAKRAPQPQPPQPSKPPEPPSPEAMELAAWNAVASSTDPAVLEAFLKRFPNGVYAGIARARLEEMRGKTARESDAEARQRAAAEEARQVEQALGLNEAERRRVQLGLRQRGFDAGQPDGVFGPQTRAMVARFQQSRGEPPTGFLTRVQYEALTREVSPPAPDRDRTVARPQLNFDRRHGEPNSGWSRNQRQRFVFQCVLSCERNPNLPASRRGACGTYCDCLADEGQRLFSAADYQEMDAAARTGRQSPKTLQFQNLAPACNRRAFGQ